MLSGGDTGVQGMVSSVLILFVLTCVPSYVPATILITMNSCPGKQLPVVAVDRLLHMLAVESGCLVLASSFLILSIVKSLP